MATITKLELQQALTARNAELEAARLRIATLEGDVAALSAKLARADSASRGAPVRSAYVPREPSAQQTAFRAACAQARDLAMRTGKSVKVSVR